MTNDELRALAEKATKGKRQWSAIKGHAFDQVYIDGCEPFCDVHAGNPYDAAYIAAACNEVPRLLDENAALSARVKALEIEIAAARLALTHPHGEIGVGDQVQKITGYLWPGEVRAVYTTCTGAVRYVVECTAPAVAGAQHIFNGDQIARAALEGK